MTFCESAERVWVLQFRIGVEKQVAIAGGPARTLIKRVDLANPSRRRSGAAKGREAGIVECGEYLPRLVFGIVIPDEDLKVGVVLGRKAWKEPPQVIGLVAGRDAHREGGIGVGRRRS